MRTEPRPTRYVELNTCDGPRDVEALESEVAGLVVHKCLGLYLHDTWVVTHAPSGRCVSGSDRDSERAALALSRRLAKVVDWTLGLADLV
ncbi:MAG: hypothetical protein M3024_12735, partial [Candidatus Dormibacteraeota bacterium]|nr:hypothetical protein [Candidatus Dormibacteraeota bacterium]